MEDHGRSGPRLRLSRNPMAVWRWCLWLSTVVVGAAVAWRFDETRPLRHICGNNIPDIMAIVCETYATINDRDEGKGQVFSEITRISIRARFSQYLNEVYCFY